MIRLRQSDPFIVTWWTTREECHSAMERRVRAGSLTVAQARWARTRLAALSARAYEVPPSEAIRADAERLLGAYPLRAADALHLAAAHAWALGNPAGREFVCLDERLRTAAQVEGFGLLPASL